MSEFWQDSESRKNFENVFNEETLRALYKLADEGHFNHLHGFAKLGKESNVCIADTGDGDRIAVKIYMVEAGNYQEMSTYLLNDPRFEGIADSRRDLVFAWCRKEYKNLMKAQQADVPAPRPIEFNKNILLMDFLGEDLDPAPRLKDVRLEEPEREFDFIIDQMRKLWQKEDLVHGDLSEYNILWHRKPHLIDFSQGVLREHQLADKMLQRDVKNLNNHFRKRYGIQREEESILDKIKE
jgi:RIO kinase 1